MCFHENTLDDVSTSTCICTDCGLVLENQIYSHQYIPNDAQHSTPQLQFLLDICDRIHVFKKAAYAAFQKYQDFLSSNIIGKEEDLSICVFYLYETLKEEKAPRSMRHISDFSGVSMKSLWNAQKKTESQSNIMLEDEYATLLENHMFRNSLCDSDLIIIKESLRLSVLNRRHFTPATVIASIIYLYCKQKKKKKITMKTIAIEFKISQMSIYRCCKHLKSVKTTLF